eukprot:INCI19163.1.p1 GENE.INCI19163.1~~INCI19163.1.p1  ORF type:complete len:878 (+),score=171.23 INCI19163.1:324-2957(+)
MLAGLARTRSALRKPIGHCSRTLTRQNASVRQTVRQLHANLREDYFENIGTTPMVEVCPGTSSADSGRVFAKLEGHNPGGSIKDRAITSAMMNLLERLPSQSIEDPTAVPTFCLVTSGRAGVTMARLARYIEASGPLSSVICIPERYKDMQAPRDLCNDPSVNVVYSFDELKDVQSAAGNDSTCTVVLLPGTFLEVLEASKSHAAAQGGAWQMVDQHFDEACALSHDRTVREILVQCPGVTDVVCAVGTGATAAGLRRYMPKRIKVHARPAVSGQIDGIADVDRYNNYCDTKNLEGYHCGEFFSRENALGAQQLLKEEGISAGPSSGATLWLARNVAASNPDAKVVMISADGRLAEFEGQGQAGSSPNASQIDEETKLQYVNELIRQQQQQRRVQLPSSPSFSRISLVPQVQRPRKLQQCAFSTSTQKNVQWKDHVIVGGGPVGSATAWFLAERAAEQLESPPSVALIHDPRNRGAHEDWSRLARLSFDGPQEEYDLSLHALELLDLADEVRSMQSGAAVVPLRPGMLFVASPGTNMAKLCERGEGYGDKDFRRVSPSELETLFPGNEFALPDDTLCWTSPRGYCVSPLELAETQRKLAQAYGAEILEGVASVNVSSDDSSVFEVTVAGGADSGSEPTTFATRHCYLMAGAHNKRLLKESVERGNENLEVTPFEETYISAISTVRYKHVNHPATPAEGSGHVVTPIVLGQLNVPDLLPYEANFSIVAEDYGDVLKTRLSGAAGKETIPTVEALHSLVSDDQNAQMAADYQALFGTLFPFLETDQPLDFNRCVTYRNRDPAYSGTSLLAHKIGDESGKTGTLLTTPGCFGVGVKFGPALGEAAAAYVAGEELVKGMNVLDSSREPTPIDDTSFVERAW